MDKLYFFYYSLIFKQRKTDSQVKVWNSLYKNKDIYIVLVI